VARSDPRLQRDPRFLSQRRLLDGVSYLDGGVSDAIPVQEAARRGAQTIVVIRTVPSQMFYTPQWFKRMERWLGESSLQPFVNLVQHHEATYRTTQQFIEKPPGKLRILEIYPQKPKYGAGKPFTGAAGRLQDRATVRTLFPRDGRQTAGRPSTAGASSAASHAAGLGCGAGGFRRQRFSPGHFRDRPQANDASFDNEDLA
jgi:predicted acylesterase/phospholipase RssA